MLLNTQNVLFTNLCVYNYSTVVYCIYRVIQSLEQGILFSPLTLRLFPKKNRLYMDTAIDNAFYVFDEEGKYLCFSLC